MGTYQSVWNNRSPLSLDRCAAWVLASFRPLGAALEWKGFEGGGCLERCSWRCTVRLLHGFSMASPWLFLPARNSWTLQSAFRQLEQNGLIRENMWKLVSIPEYSEHSTGVCDQQEWLCERGQIFGHLAQPLSSSSKPKVCIWVPWHVWPCGVQILSRFQSGTHFTKTWSRAPWQDQMGALQCRIEGRAFSCF